MKKKLVALFTLTIILALPTFSLAIIQCQPDNPKCPNFDPGLWFPNIIDRFLGFIVWPIFTGAIIIMFIVAGFLFLTAHGDVTKTTIARKAVLWAAVGTAVGLLAFSVEKFITRILGIA